MKAWGLAPIVYLPGLAFRSADSTGGVVTHLPAISKCAFLSIDTSPKT